MARKKVGVLNLDSAIKEILEEYGEDVYEVLSEAVEDVTEEGVKKLQSVNSFAPGGNPSGEYSADWTFEDVSKGRLQKKRVIHNSDHYRLTHLLEKGHVSRNGTGRTFGRVPAYPHIKDVEDWAITALPKKVKELIK